MLDAQLKFVEYQWYYYFQTSLTFHPIPNNQPVAKTDQ